MEDAMSKKLLLVDLSHIFWSTHFATAGQDVDASFRVSYQRVHQMRSGFDAVAICCDIGPSWRKDIYPDYKAGRQERDQAAYDQLRRVREQLEADGYPVHAVKGFEADDIIATLAAKAAGHDFDTVIATGDKDLLQLVGGPVSVMSTNAGGGRLGADEVKAKFGVTPQQLGDYLALVGDKSDNIPGVPGIGAKHAARLLNEFATIAGIYDALEKVTPPSIQDALHAPANRDRLAMARTLVGLSFNVPLDFEAAIAPVVRKEPEAAMDERDLGTEEQEPVENLISSPPPNFKPVALVPQTEAKTEPHEVALALAKAEETVLDRQNPRWMLALEPQNARAAYAFAKTLHASQLYRKFPNAEAIFAVILRGRSMGLDVMTTLDGFHVIEGKPTASSMLIIGCVLNSGKAEYFELEEHDDQHATWVTKRIGSKREQRMTITLDDAKRSGVARPGGNWTKYPGAMLRKQAGVELARAVYPDVVCNVYDPQELGEVG